MSRPAWVTDEIAEAWRGYTSACVALWAQLEHRLPEGDPRTLEAQGWAAEATAMAARLGITEPKQPN